MVGLREHQTPLNSPAGMVFALVFVAGFGLMATPTSDPRDVEVRVETAAPADGGQRWRIEAVVVWSEDPEPVAGERITMQDRCVDDGKPGDTIEVTCSQSQWDTLTGAWRCRRPRC